MSREAREATPGSHEAFDGEHSLMVTNCGEGGHVRIEQRLKEPLEPGAFYLVKVRYRFGKTSTTTGCGAASRAGAA